MRAVRVQRGRPVLEGRLGRDEGHRPVYAASRWRPPVGLTVRYSLSTSSEPVDDVTALLEEFSRGRLGD